MGDDGLPLQIRGFAFIASPYESYWGRYVRLTLWGISALYAGGAALLLGIPTILIPNHLFSRTVAGRDLPCSEIHVLHHI